MKKLLLILIIIFSVSFIQANEIFKTDVSSIKKDSVLDSMIFDRAEVMPQYPGGAAELMKYLSTNIHYPEEAREKNLEGKVIIRFTVDTDGSIVNPIVLKDGVGGGGCKEEAIRVIMMMPKWLPGSQKGTPVKVYYTLPISFKLSNDISNEQTIANKKMDAIFKGGDVQLEFYKQDILSKIKKSKKEKSQHIIVEVLITIDEFGKVENAIVIQDNTDNKQNIDAILKGIKSMPNWFPAMLNGKTIMSQKKLIFEY